MDILDDESQQISLFLTTLDELANTINNPTKQKGYDGKNANLTEREDSASRIENFYVHLNIKVNYKHYLCRKERIV